MTMTTVYSVCGAGGLRLCPHRRRRRRCYLSIIIIIVDGNRGLATVNETTTIIPFPRHPTPPTCRVYNNRTSRDAKTITIIIVI